MIDLGVGESELMKKSFFLTPPKVGSLSGGTGGTENYSINSPIDNAIPTFFHIQHLLMTPSTTDILWHSISCSDSNREEIL
jgi:hypothetical protein